MSRPHFDHEVGCIIPSQLDKAYLPKSVLWKLFLRASKHLTWKPSGFKKVAQHYKLALPKYTLDLLDGDLNLITTLPAFTKDLVFPDNYQSVGPIICVSALWAASWGESNYWKARQQKSQSSICDGQFRKSFIDRKAVSLFCDHRLWGDRTNKSYLTEDSLLEYPCLWLAASIGGFWTCWFSWSMAAKEPCKSPALLANHYWHGLQYEQEVNIAYCENFGNSACLPPNKLTIEALSRSIKKLQSPDYRKKAEEMQRWWRESLVRRLRLNK